MKRHQSKSPRIEESDTEESDSEDSKEYIVTINTQSRWWWFTIWFDDPQEAIDWKPSNKHKFKYAVYRAHASPTSGRPHVHCLIRYKSGMRYGTLKKRGYNNIKFIKSHKRKIRCRNYVLNDNHRNGSTKGVISNAVEIGTWNK